MVFVDICYLIYIEQRLFFCKFMYKDLYLLIFIKYIFIFYDKLKLQEVDLWIIYLIF